MSIEEAQISHPEAAMIAEFEKVGEKMVRKQLRAGVLGDQNRTYAESWLDSLERARDAASLAPQLAANDLASNFNILASEANVLASEANVLSHAANTTALEANALAFLANKKAKTANIIATMALIAAVIAVVASIFGLFLRH